MLGDPHAGPPVAGLSFALPSDPRCPPRRSARRRSSASRTLQARRSGGARPPPRPASGRPCTRRRAIAGRKRGSSSAATARSVTRGTFPWGPGPPTCAFRSRRAWVAGRRPTRAQPVYLSIDLDAFDPAFAPGVSHREPGGLTVRDVLTVLHGLAVPLVGADVVELNPGVDPSGVTAVVAAKLVKELAGKMLAS